MRAPQWAKATEILSVEKPVEKMAVGGPENQEKPWENPGKTGKNQEKPGKTRKNHGKFMEIWDFSTELGKKSFNVRELVGWTRKQQEREGSNPLRLSKLGYPVCISKRFGVLLLQPAISTLYHNVLCKNTQVHWPTVKSHICLHHSNCVVPQQMQMCFMF